MGEIIKLFDRKGSDAIRQAFLGAAIEAANTHALLKDYGLQLHQIRRARVDLDVAEQIILNAPGDTKGSYVIALENAQWRLAYARGQVPEPPDTVA